MTGIVRDQDGIGGQCVGGDHHVHFAYGLAARNQLMPNGRIIICCCAIPWQDGNDLQKLAHRKMQTMFGGQFFQTIH
jgi:hypothetical protein